MLAYYLLPSCCSNITMSMLRTELQIRQQAVMSPSILTLTVLGSICGVYCQENPSQLETSYNVGPYRHIYPPADISADQQACLPDAASNRTCPLYVALLMSFGGSFTSSGVVPAIQLALDQINSDPTMLPGYTLHYTLKDSQVRKINIGGSLWPNKPSNILSSLLPCQGLDN